MRSLSEFATKQQISGATLNGLGAALWAELGFYSLEQKSYKWRKFDQPLEITNLTGNVASLGSEIVLHVHGTFTDESFRAFGGHVRELAVAGTCEIFLNIWPADLRRSIDTETGLNLLEL